MNKPEIILKLNNTQKIVIHLEEPLNEIHCCSDALITFHENNQILKLENNTLTFSLPTLTYLLTKAINNKLPLHKSVEGKIGYQYAQDVFFAYDKNTLEPLGLVFDKNNDWIGRKYLLWSYDFAVWMYNDKYGNIKLEITSVYKGGYFDPEDSNGVEAYEQFLKNYKSYLTTTISRETAQQWLDQANDILKHIDENIKRLVKEQEEREKNTNDYAQS